MIYPVTFMRFVPDMGFRLHKHGHEGNSYGHVADKDGLDEVLDSINNRLKEDTKPFPPNPKVYLGKNCKIARDKVKTIFDTNKYHKTRIAEYADAIILDKYSSVSLNRYNFLLIDKDRLEYIKSTPTLTNSLLNKDVWVSQLQQQLGNIKHIAVLYDAEIINLLGSEVRDWFKSYYVFNKWGDNKEVDILNNLVLCNSNEKAQILDSTKFNGDILQKDLIIIDDEVYDNMSEMARSKQSDDIRMLANLIDNCNLKESHYFINLLIIDNIIHGSNTLSKYLRKETHEFLKTTGKKFFEEETSTYSVRYIILRMKQDEDYQKMSRMLKDVEGYILGLVKREIMDRIYWLNDFGYEITGTEDINIKNKTNAS